MKKIVLSLAGVLAATAFAPEAAAVPSFARQTGMACGACHFQSYPALTGFGKAFKTAGFTMMGSQGKIEGEHGLSIPAELNMSVYFQARYIKTNGTDAQGAAGTGEVRSTNSGRIDVPDEMSLFAAGRVAENIGAITEINIAGPAGGLAAVKLPIMFDMGGMKVGLIPFTDGAAGPQWGYDVFATGSVANARVTENGGGYSAAMYLGTDTAASGAAVVVASETFHVNITPWAQALAASNQGLTATKLGGTYIRAAYTPSMAGWDLGIGVQNFSGNSLKGVGTIVPGSTRNSATVIDFQGQGEVAAMPIGVYGSYGWAPGQTRGAVNTYNAGPARKSAFGLLADVGVMPNTLNALVGFMRNKTGAMVGNESDNSFTLGVRYKLTQNVKAALAYTKSSGSAYNAGGSSPNATRGAGKGNSLTTFILSTGF